MKNFKCYKTTLKALIAQQKADRHATANDRQQQQYR